MAAARRILVVDDEELVRDAFESSIQRMGYEVDVASSGPKALELLSSTDYDLILSDIKMPQMSGIELLKQIKEQSAESVVIMVTAHGTVESSFEAMELGAFNFIHKPVNLDELEIMVEKGLEHRDLKVENRILRSEVRTRYNFGNIVGADKKFRDLLKMLESASKSRATILIRGESGTVKELFARAIHYNSARADRAFIKLNCAALPEGLIESELFGHEKGAFTHAIKQSQGRFEMADGGTLLLDEISEIPAGVQAKLLRVLQEMEFERVGSAQTIKVDVRIVATSNRNLEKMIKQGEFREDLFYRLNVIPLHLPSLRDRKQDVPMLAEHFLRKYNEQNERDIKGFTARALRLLSNYHWPGNVRELENYIERAVVLCPSDRISDSDLPSYLALGELAQHSPATLEGEMTIAEMEKVAIINTLEKYGGNRTRAAEVLGISSRTLRNKLHEYGLMGSDSDTEASQVAAGENRDLS
jgi:DNA-binding NtrC family response regulator